MALPPDALRIIDELVAAAPPLTPEQERVIAAVFARPRPGIAPGA